MKDSSLLASIVVVYAALAVVFYVVTTVNGKPFLIPLVTAFWENWRIE
jgi:VIT1/CCC1 family predicted Fe2+/Mn2+ transporter